MIGCKYSLNALAHSFIHSFYSTSDITQMKFRGGDLGGTGRSSLSKVRRRGRSCFYPPNIYKMSCKFTI